MAKLNTTIVELDFPKPPKVSERPEKQEEFERWYFNYNTTIRREMERLAAKIDELTNKK